MLLLDVEEFRFLLFFCFFFEATLLAICHGCMLWAGVCSPPQGSTLGTSTMPAFAGLPPHPHPKTFHQKGHSPHPVLHESQAVSPCWASRQPDGKRSRMVQDPLSSHPFCILRQVNKCWGHGSMYVSNHSVCFHYQHPYSAPNNMLLSPEVKPTPSECLWKNYSNLANYLLHELSPFSRICHFQFSAT